MFVFGRNQRARSMRSTVPRWRPEAQVMALRACGDGNRIEAVTFPADTQT
jgi:hypothetical protein